MLRLPKSLRKELRKPFGELHKSVNLIEKSLQKQLEAVEQAESKAIDRATPKFNGVG